MIHGAKGIAGSKSRSLLAGLDLARYFALAGMVFVNFKQAMHPLSEEPGWLLALLHFLEGKASATFVVLAGLGLVLATRSQDSATARVWTLRRALFLLVAGALNLLIFPADIIHCYAVYFVLAIAWLQAGPRALLAGILGVAAASWWALLHLDYSQAGTGPACPTRACGSRPALRATCCSTAFTRCCRGLRCSCTACCWPACRWPRCACNGAWWLRVP